MHVMSITSSRQASHGWRTFEVVYTLPIEHAYFDLDARLATAQKIDDVAHVLWGLCLLLHRDQRPPLVMTERVYGCSSIAAKPKMSTSHKQNVNGDMAGRPTDGEGKRRRVYGRAGRRSALRWLTLELACWPWLAGATLTLIIRLCNTGDRAPTRSVSRP